MKTNLSVCLFLLLIIANLLWLPKVKLQDRNKLLEKIVIVIFIGLITRGYASDLVNTIKLL